MGPNMPSLDQGLTDASTAKLWLRGTSEGSSNRGGFIPRSGRPNLRARSRDGRQRGEVPSRRAVLALRRSVRSEEARSARWPANARFGRALDADCGSRDTLRTKRGWRDMAFEVFWVRLGDLGAKWCRSTLLFVNGVTFSHPEGADSMWVRGAAHPRHQRVTTRTKGRYLMRSATTLCPAHEPSAGVAVTALAQKGPLGSSPSPFKNPCRRGDPSPVIKLGGLSYARTIPRLPLG